MSPAVAAILENQEKKNYHVTLWRDESASPPDREAIMFQLKFVPYFMAPFEAHNNTEIRVGVQKRPEARLFARLPDSRRECEKEISAMERRRTRRQQASYAGIRKNSRRPREHLYQRYLLY